MTKRAITYRLLKAGIENPADSLKENHRLEEMQLRDRPENKRLYAGQAYNNPPKWLSFFNPDDRVLFDRLRGAQAAAILFVRFEVHIEGEGNFTRWIAVCFGLGVQALRQEALESQFGLKVALNRIGQARIKSIDSRRPEEATIQTRSQSSKSGDIFEFGISTDHIILQAITGKSEDEDFGGTLTGSDGLKLNSEVSYADIDDKISQIGEAFFSDDFERLFPWYGKITPVRDKILSARLEGELVERLKAGQFANVHLAPPEIVDYQHIDSFKYSGQSRGDEGYDELRIADYMRLYDGIERTLTAYDLKNDHVKVKSEDQTAYYQKWTVYKCISAEVEVEDTLYVLAAGEWYAVLQDFVARINEELGAIEAAAVDLPAYLRGEVEGDYNRRAAENPGIHLFDKNLIHFSGERGRIEFCDLLTDNRQIIHVKRRSQSSQLSHLFMQGFVSAEAFIDYEELRRQVRATHPGVAHLIPEDRPDAQQYELVYVILHEGQPVLPFFSKVALVGMAKQLARMRFAVRLNWVGV